MSERVHSELRAGRDNLCVRFRSSVLVSDCVTLFFYISIPDFIHRENEEVLKKVNGRNGEKKEEKERNMRSAVVFAISVRLR